jgi:hypothetical protein
MKRVPVLVALAIAASMALPGTVSAAPPSLSITGVTVSGGTGSVSGTAAFTPVGTHSVVTEESVKANGQIADSQVGEAAGIQLTDVSITPINRGLRFAWHVASLPEQILPEQVRYTWAFQIGDRIYQLIAKRTNLLTVNTLDDPAGYAERLASQKPFFQIRGGCTSTYRGVPLNGCYHLGFLEGAFDVANKRISMDLPFEAKNSFGSVILPDLKPGAIIQEYAGSFVGNSAVTAAIQYGPVSTADVSANLQRSINGLAPYHVGPQVVLGVATPGQDPSSITYSAPGILSGNTFSGTVSGLSASKNTVYARACNGTECTYSTFKAL